MLISLESLESPNLNVFRYYTWPPEKLQHSAESVPNLQPSNADDILVVRTRETENAFSYVATTLEADNLERRSH